MYPPEETTESSCSGCRQQHPHGILYGILIGRKARHLDCATATPTCHCKRRTVCLKDPKTTCRVASDVLVKTMRFLRSLPSFRQLPRGDQLSLLKHSWVPLFVLGLAQDKIFFEVTDRPNSSLLRKILLGPGSTQKEAEQPTPRDVGKLRTCLHQLWNLDLSPKEYAYLKGALLFDPGKTMSVVTKFARWVLKSVKDCAPRSVGLLQPSEDWTLRPSLKASNVKLGMRSKRSSASCASTTPLASAISFEQPPPFRL